MKHKATRKSVLARNMLRLQKSSIIPIGWFPGEWKQLSRAQNEADHIRWLMNKEKP